jgi:hypothetical protein
MSSAALGAEEVGYPRRFAAARPAADTLPPTDARARTRTRTSHLSAVPAGATAAAPTSRPVRGSARPAAAPTSRPAATKAAKRSRTMPRINVSAAPLRTVGRVLYRDTVDGWIVRTPAPSIAEVWNFEYAVPGDWAPFRIWCKVWTRTAGTLVAATLDGIKWVLIHPVRGPLAIGGGGAAALTTYLMTH